MQRAMNFLLGAAVGGIVGATLVLLLTPSSGENLRKQMREQTERIKTEVQEAAAARRTELEKQLATLRQTSKTETRIEIPD